MKTETLRKKLKRMPSHLSFWLRTNIYCTNLGLKKAVVFAEATPGYEDALLDCLAKNDFWIFLDRCHSGYEGCFGIYTIPEDHTNQFEQFIQSLEATGIARNIRMLWSTCFQSVNSKTNWFDEKSKTWMYSWDKWVEEVPTKKTELPYTLVDPKDYPVEGDEIDVFVLKELEKNPTISLRALSKILGVSEQVVEYHYQKHILERNLIESFEVVTLHHDMSLSDMFIFIFRFDNMEKCTKFAASLLDKPFVSGLGKILDENGLIVDIYLPKLEFRRFVDALSKLARKGLLQSYNYVTLDPAKSRRQTISYEYFKNGSWVYEHNRHLQNLKSLVEQARS